MEGLQEGQDLVADSLKPVWQLQVDRKSLT